MLFKSVYQLLLDSNMRLNLYFPFGWRLRVYTEEGYRLWRLRGYTDDERFVFKFLNHIWTVQEIPWWRR